MITSDTTSTPDIRDTKISRNKLLAIAGLGWLFDAMDVGLLSFVLAALSVEWGLNSQQLGWIGGINSIGMAIGAFVFGIYADKRGRKVAFIATLLLFSIGSGLSAFAWGLTSFVILRFLIGMGLGGELPVASTLVSENVAARERGRVVVLLESFWAGGWIVAALIAYFLMPIEGFGWRGAMLMCAMPAFYALYLRISLPDSISFKKLSQKDKKETIVHKLRLLWSPAYRRSTIMLWLLWFGVVFSYYGMFLWLPKVVMSKGFGLSQSFGYVLLMTLAQLPGYFTVAWLIERIGRKIVLTLYLTGTMLGAYWFGAANSLNQILVAGALLSFFNLGAWGALYAYTPEQYIAKVRATGAGFAAAVGRIGGIFGPLMVGYLMALDFGISAIFNIFCASILISILAVLFLGKETKQTIID
ncbi:MAG: MFS transporter [Burkholderiales bacterium]|jgi:putative MFS transporter|nr:MFS transporter [Burkholderiales bacterium]